VPDFNLGTARGRIEIDGSGAKRGVEEAQGAVKGLDKDLDAAAGTFGKAGLAMGGIGVAAVAGFGLAVNAASNFEKGLSAISAVSGATEQQMEGIRKKALQIGADTKFSASEGAAAIEELAKAGIPLEGIINGAADATVALAAAGEVELPEAATIASNAMNQFGLAAADMPKVADLIAGAANASAIDVSDFGFALSQAGATANLVGLSFDDLSVAIAAMGNAGIKGSDAGTSLKTFLSNLQPTTEKQIGLMQKLGIVTEDGANKFFDASGNIKSMSEIAGVLSTSLAGMTAQQKSMALETLFGSDAIRAAAIIADNGAAGFDKLAANMGKVTAADVAAKRMDNLAGSMEQLKGSVETVMIQAGAPFQDVLRGVVDGLTGIVNVFGSLSPGMQKWIVIAVLATGVLIGLGGAALLTISGFLKAKKTIEEFRAAVQALELASKRQMIAEKARQAVTKVGTAIQWAFNAAMSANPIFLVVAALVALGAALFVAYKKFEPFRNVVDTVWRFVKNFVTQLGNLWNVLRSGDDVIQGVAEVLDNMFGNTGKLIAPIKAVLNVFKEVFDWLKSNWDLLLPIFLGPLGLIIVIWRRFGDDIKEFIGKAIDAVVDFFQKLPGRIMGFLTAAIAAVIEFLAKLPERAAFFIGFMLGAFIRGGFEIVKFFIKLGIDVISAVVEFMTKLPGRVLGFLNLVWDTLYEWGTRFVSTMIQIGSDAIEGFIGFLVALPGRVLGFLNAVWDHLWQFGVNAVNKAREIGTNVLNGVIEFVTQLPGKVATAFTNVVSGIGNFIVSAKNKAGEIGSAVVDGVINFAKDLPSKAGDIIQSMIDTIKGFVGKAFDTLKNVGSSMWNGFKKGIGIGSPSLPERAVTEMVKNIGAEMRPLARHVGTIQGLAADLPSVDSTMAVGIGAGVLTPATGQGSGVAASPGSAGGPLIGELNINNPIGEPSEESLTRTMQKLEYAGYFGG